MKVGVKILPRNEVLDTQGRAVAATLKGHGYETSAVRVGKYVQLEVPGGTKAEALDQARAIAEFVLVNPLIESFDLEVLVD